MAQHVFCLLAPSDTLAGKHWVFALKCMHWLKTQDWTEAIEEATDYMAKNKIPRMDLHHSRMQVVLPLTVECVSETVSESTG